MKAVVALVFLAVASFAVPSLLAQAVPAPAPVDRIAELEARLVALEAENRALRSALATAAARAVTTPPPAPVPAPAGGPTPAQAAAMQAVRDQIAAIEAGLKASAQADPFADKPRLGVSAADRKKQADLKQRELADLRLRLAAMEAAVR